MSVDGVDCRVKKKGKRWWSHKFKKGGVRYEVGLCILTGDICRLNGSYKCGKWPDISIFRNSLVSHLAPNERIEADDGYIGEAPAKVKCPASFTIPEETEAITQRVRNRQETVNKRFKNWEILAVPFRNDVYKHGDAFRVIAIFTQLSINSGEPLFDVHYNDEHPFP
jgi:hypothetical protein